MKQIATIILMSGALLPFAACNKKAAQDIKPSAPTFNAPANAKGGGGSTPTTTGPIQNFLSGTAARIVATYTDSLFVSFTQQAPVAGYTLTVSSSDTGVHTRATVFAPQGAYNVSVPVISSAVTSAKSATITVSLGGQTKTSTIKVYPLHYTFSAPSLQSPGNGSSFGYHRFITFQWAANANAWYSELQISAVSSFATLIYSFGTESNLYPADYFNGTGVRYWRVRYVDGSGTGGPWSAVRSFEVKPQ